MDLAKLKIFQDLVNCMCKINQDTASPTFIILYNDRINVMKGFRFKNLSDCIGILAIGTKKWRNGPFKNESAILLAMADNQYGIVEEIEVSDKWVLSDLDFEEYRSSYYDCFKPILKLRNKITNETKEIRPKEEGGWDADFPDIFNQLFALVKE